MLDVLLTLFVCMFSRGYKPLKKHVTFANSTGADSARGAPTAIPRAADAAIAPAAARTAVAAGTATTPSPSKRKRGSPSSGRRSVSWDASHSISSATRAELYLPDLMLLDSDEDDDEEYCVSWKRRRTTSSSGGVTVPLVLGTSESRVQLNGKLGEVVQELVKYEANHGGGRNGAFDGPVQLQYIPDYLDWVPFDKQMCIQKMEQKVGN